MLNKAWGLIFLVFLSVANSAFADECVQILSFIKPVPLSVLHHTQEARGFVTVPFDYDHPEAGVNLKIFYRFLPTEGGSVIDSSKPIAVIVNGGPGYSSEHFRALDHDYTKADETTLLKKLSQTHRVLLMDQRGTGQSAPLNMEDPKLNPYWVAANFNANQVARDLGLVINEVIAPDERFYMVAQSYGGMVATVYLVEATKGKSTMRMPTGIVFASPALPYGDFIAREFHRRVAQKELNEQLLKAVPGINAKIMQLRRKVQRMDQNSAYVDSLYRLFFDALEPGWEQKMARVIESKLELSRSKLQEEVRNDKRDFPLLNYILYSAMVIPGHTDKGVCRDMIKRIPFSDWMIDECRHYVKTELKALSQKLIVDMVDRTPPPAISFPTKEEFKAALAKTKPAFFVAVNDGAVSAFALRDLANEVSSEETPFFLFEAGGHTVTFEEEGHEIIQLLGFN
jgi:pimeloyl-ACP methyl ester carboxylesterase